MQCLHCNCKKFEVKKKHFSPEILGEKVDVVVPSFICINCDTSLMDAEQLNVLRNRAADTYRKAHNLLTSEEIIKYRASLGMS